MSCWGSQDWIKFSYISICVNILTPITEVFGMNLLSMILWTLSVLTTSGIGTLLMMSLSGVSSL